MTTWLIHRVKSAFVWVIFSESNTNVAAFSRKATNLLLLRAEYGVVPYLQELAALHVAITIAGSELAHRIHKRHFSFGLGRPRRNCSLKVRCSEHSPRMPLVG